MQLEPLAFEVSAESTGSSDFHSFEVAYKWIMIVYTP